MNRIYNSIVMNGHYAALVVLKELEAREKYELCSEIRDNLAKLNLHSDTNRISEALEYLKEHHPVLVHAQYYYINKLWHDINSFLSIESLREKGEIPEGEVFILIKREDKS